MEEISLQLIKEVEKTFKDKRFLTDEVLSALDFIFHGCLLQALDLVDRKQVCLLKSPSRRSIYQVTGSTGVPYYCFISCNYCACPAFKFCVLNKGDVFWCKHLLSIKLSGAMNALQEKEIRNEDLAAIINNLD